MGRIRTLWDLNSRNGIPSPLEYGVRGKGQGRALRLGRTKPRVGRIEVTNH